MGAERVQRVFQAGDGHAHPDREGDVGHREVGIGHVMHPRYGVDCVVANILMTRYKEIRLVFNTASEKNANMTFTAEQQNERATVELIVKADERPLESQFVPRLIAAHDLYLSQYSCFLNTLLSSWGISHKIIGTRISLGSE